MLPPLRNGKPALRCKGCLFIRYIVKQQNLFQDGCPGRNAALLLSVCHYTGRKIQVLRESLTNPLPYTVCFSLKYKILVYSTIGMSSQFQELLPHLDIY
jgi:hypothetical protein